MMKTYKKPNSNIRYLYNETAEGKNYKGIVIALLEGCQHDLLNELYRCPAPPAIGRFSFSLKNTYKGIAYCSKEDEFNLEEGMKIARERALRKYYNDRNNLLAEWAGDVTDRVNAVLAKCYREKYEDKE